MALLGAHSFENNQYGAFSVRNQVSLDSTSKVVGTYSVKIDNQNSTGINSNIYYTYSLAVNSYYQYFKFLVPTAGQYRIIAGSTCGLNHDQVVSLYYNSDNKLGVLGYTATGKGGGYGVNGSVALSSNTVYQIQLYYSTNGGPNGRAYISVKVHDMAGTLIDSFSVEHGSSTGLQVDEVAWGNSDKAWYDTIANLTYIDDIWLNDTTGSNNNGWPGLLDMTMVKPASQGTYNDYTGYPETTNKYQNWDETVRDDADYNRTPDNNTGAPFKQTSGVETLATGKTIRGLVVYGYYSQATSSSRQIVREGSTDYENTVWSGSLFATKYDTLPSGGALTNAAVSALEIGAQWTGEAGLGQNFNPTSDSAKTNWAGVGDTTNLYNNVDEVTADGDTTYNYTTTQNAKISHGATFSWGDYVIYGVSVYFYARVTAGTGYARGFLTIGGVDYENTTQHTLNTTYAAKQALWTTNPATGNPWLRSEVEAAKFGVKNESADGTEMRVTFQKPQIAVQQGHKVHQTFILAVNDETTEAGAGATNIVRMIISNA